MSTSRSVAKPWLETETSPFRRRLDAQAADDERLESYGAADQPGQGEGSEPAAQRALGDTDHQTADGEHAQCRPGMPNGGLSGPFVAGTTVIAAAATAARTIWR
jgi:hypothetical protein